MHLGGWPRPTKPITSRRPSRWRPLQMLATFLFREPSAPASGASRPTTRAIFGNSSNLPLVWPAAARPEGNFAPPRGLSGITKLAQQVFWIMFRFQWIRAILARIEIDEDQLKCKFGSSFQSNASGSAGRHPPPRGGDLKHRVRHVGPRGSSEPLTSFSKEFL